jgi:hypothetical protein
MIRIITATEPTLIVGFIPFRPCSANSSTLANVRGLPALFYLRILRPPLQEQGVASNVSHTSTTAGLHQSGKADDVMNGLRNWATFPVRVKSGSISSGYGSSVFAQR